MKRRSDKKGPDRRVDTKQPPRPSPDAPVPRGRRLLFQLLAVVLLPLVTFAVLEAGLRIGGYGHHTGFFKTTRIENRDYLVNNEDYGLRFFPPELARFSGPIRIAADKPSDTFRIFILGESAAMGDPEPSFGASRYLDVLLRERFPQQKFEIINTAITAINSHVILPIARDCARQHGDLWIIYMGNNEMVGPFGAATVFGAQAPPLELVRLSLAIQRTRTGQLLMALARKLRGKASSSSWGGMEMFIGNQLPPDSSRKQTVYRNFEHNLRDIVQAGLDSGAKVVLNTVAVNLKDCPPFASISNSHFSAASAQSNYGTAARLDTNNADAHYRWGQSLLQETNLPSAREQLQAACDTDALPFRTDSRINSLIRQEAVNQAKGNLVLLDAAMILATNQPYGLCGQETFYEHVHFNFAGNYRLGLLWAQQVEKALPAAVASKPAGPWASQETCERLLGLSDWNRILVLQSLIRRFSQAPLSGQFNNVERRQAIETRLKELKQQLTPAVAAQARTDFEDALRHAPNDHYLHEVFAEFLQSTGDLAAATQQWKQVHDLLPQDFLSYYQLGRLYSMQNQWPEAENCLEQVVAAHPGMIEAWYELGGVHVGQAKYERALVDYEEAAKRRPKDPRILCGMGKALAGLKRRPEAIEKFRQAIQLNPDFWDAHFELGGELAFDEKVAEARAEFAEAVRIQPGNPRGHFNLGVMLAKQNRFDDAAREFEETLRLEPGNQKAATYLAQLRALKGGAPSHTP